MKKKYNIYILLYVFILFGCAKTSRIINSVDGLEGKKESILFPKKDNCYEEQFSNLEDLSLEVYNRFRLIGWGITSHRDLRPIDWFSNFLDQVGNDENLKYIFVEMSHVAKKTFERMSISGIAAGKDASAELGGLNIFYLEPHVKNHQARSEFFQVVKKVAKLNQKRKNKIQIVPIESVFGLNGEQIYEVNSWNREDHTMRNFMPYYKKMKPTEKAIFLYHTTHLARHIKGKSDYFVGTKYGEPKDDYVSFLGQAKINDDDFGLIVFDSPLQVVDGGQYFTRLFRPPFGYNDATSFYRLGDGANFSCLNGNNFFKAIYRQDLRFEKKLSNIFNYMVYMSDDPKNKIYF